MTAALFIFSAGLMVFVALVRQGHAPVTHRAGWIALLLCGVVVTMVALGDAPDGVTDFSRKVQWGTILVAMGLMGLWQGVSHRCGQAAGSWQRAIAWAAWFCSILAASNLLHDAMIIHATATALGGKLASMIAQTLVCVSSSLVVGGVFLLLAEGASGSTPGLLRSRRWLIGAVIARMVLSVGVAMMFGSARLDYLPALPWGWVAARWVGLVVLLAGAFLAGATRNTPADQSKGGLSRPLTLLLLLGLSAESLGVWLTIRSGLPF